jgi:hypothetical protein
MTYDSAIRMLACRMDLCERLESSQSRWTFEQQDRARAEGRYATQVVCSLTGKSYAEVRRDVVKALEDGRGRRGLPKPANTVGCWDRLGM